MGKDTFVPAKAKREVPDILGAVLGTPEQLIRSELRYDYSLIPEAQRNQVQTAAVAIVKHGRTAQESLIEIGKRLIEVKDLLEHGQFGEWCATEFQLSDRMARNMMNVARQFGDKSETVSVLSDSVLYMLAAPSTPEPARIAVIERAQQTKVSPTKSEVKQVIDSYKPAPVLNTAPAEVDAPPTNGHVGYSFSDVVRIATSHVQRGQEAAREVPTLRLAASNHVISDDPNYDGDEWYTPAEYIEAARTLMGDIDLDPASCDEAQEVVRAHAYYTKQDNGLSMPWMGTVWLNPPYSTPLIRQFVTKLIEEHDKGNVTEAVILTNNSSDTAWFHDLLARYPACFTRGRVQFWQADSKTFGARQGQTLFYLGNNPTGFRQAFGQFGQVVRRYDD